MPVAEVEHRRFTVAALRTATLSSSTITFLAGARSHATNRDTSCYLHEELLALDALAAKVLSVHGERHPELVDVRRLVAELRSDLEPHLLKEESVLFPAIHALAAGRTNFAFGSIAEALRVMGVEHEQAGKLLAELRAVSGAYAVPADGCASFRSLYERLEAFEVDTHLHIHKENHVLFPTVLRLAGLD